MRIRILEKGNRKILVVYNLFDSTRTLTFVEKGSDRAWVNKDISREAQRAYVRRFFERGLPPANVQVIPYYGE